MPFAGYEDHDECVSKNRDKDDPDAYCADLERRSRGAHMAYPTLIIPEGIPSSDGRSFPEGLMTWRDRVEFMFSDTTSDGHQGAQFVGNLENLRRQTVDGVTWIVGDLTYDTDEMAIEAERLAMEDKLRRVSADVAVTVEQTGTDDDGLPIVELTAAEIVGATQTPMSAFPDARILIGDEVTTLAPMVLTAAANPRARLDWFNDPDLPGPTPLHVTDEGRIYGHLATWGTCHIGFDGACVTPPKSEAGYGYFHTGAVRVEGEDVPVGQITLGTGHADLAASLNETVAHYDNTGSCVADVSVGEDDYGIWVSGALRQGADVDAVRAAALSGDWRNVNGNLELVAALAVNVPGFPIPRVAARVASGEQVSLVASGVVEQREREDLIYEALRHLTAKVEALSLVLVPDEPYPTLHADNATVTNPEVYHTPGILAQVFATDGE